MNTHCDTLHFGTDKFLENGIKGMGNFSFSWTRLKNWRACPKRFYHLQVAKDIEEPITEALRWGDEFHKAMAARIEYGDALPIGMGKYDALPTLMRRHKERGGDVRVELSMAMSRDFQPTGWQEWDRTWLRAKIDVLYLAPWKKTAAAIDWKTGQKIEPEFEQLGLSAALIFAKHPEIDTVHTAYQWAAHDTDTQVTYLRDEMVPFWNKLMPELKRWEKDAKEMTYPPRPSGLCKRHCPVVHCAYHGKGSRQ
jgi:hypothetical protein